MDFEVGPMRLDEYNAAIDLVAHAFTTNNPIMVHTKVPFKVFRRFAVADVPKATCVATGLSLVAREKAAQGEKLLAVMFLKTFHLQQLPEEHFSHPGMATMKEIYEALYEELCLQPFRGVCLGSMTTGKTLHGGLGGTAPGAGGRGIGKALRKRAIEVARERGYNTFVVEPFHPATRHIWIKHCGCRLMAEQPLDTFVSKSRVLGKKPYEGLGGSGAMVELVLRKDTRDWPVFWLLSLLRLAWQADAFGNVGSALKGLVWGGAK